MALTKASYAMVNGTPYNVLDYGADPTGVADSRAAIQAAIDAASLANGGTVYVPSGVYKVASALGIGYGRVSLVGEGNAVIYTDSLTASIIEAGNSVVKLPFIIIDNIRFDRPAKSTDGAAVKMINTAYSVVKNCFFKNSKYGVWVKTHNDSLTIENNVFTDGTYYGVYEYNANETWANDLTIRGNFFWHVEQAAVYMSGDGVGVSSIGDTYIEDNVIVSSSSLGALQTQYAIRLIGAGSYNMNVSINRNTFEGIALQTVYLKDMNRMRIEGNYFSGTGTNDVGIYWDGGVGNSVITGNIIIGYNSHAAKFVNTGGLTIANNNFTANVTLGGAFGELQFVSCSDLQITGNYFYSASSKFGIEFLQDGGTPNNYLVVGNTFIDAPGNTNYSFDIDWQAFASKRRFADNLGNDFTSGVGTTTPSLGDGAQWYVGDTIRKTDPTVAGSGGSQYVITGWVCTTAGDPGTWSEMRTLTGT